MPLLPELSVKMKTIALITLIFINSAAKAESVPPENKTNESKEVLNVANDLKGQGKCHSLVVYAKNASGVLWIDQGKPKNSRFFWQKIDRDRFSGLITGLDYNIVKIRSDLPTEADYKWDATTASKKFRDTIEKEVTALNRLGAFKCGSATAHN